MTGPGLPRNGPAKQGVLIPALFPATPTPQVRGSLLGEHQDATVLLTDFPMATLRPIFRWVGGWEGGC